LAQILAEFPVDQKTLVEFQFELEQGLCKNFESIFKFKKFEKSLD
jgi:hypothetical protein